MTCVNTCSLFDVSVRLHNRLSDRKKVPSVKCLVINHAAGKQSSNVWIRLDRNKRMMHCLHHHENKWSATLRYQRRSNSDTGPAANSFKQATSTKIYKKAQCTHKTGKWPRHTHTYSRCSYKAANRYYFWLFLVHSVPDLPISSRGMSVFLISRGVGGSVLPNLLSACVQPELSAAELAERRLRMRWCSLSSS